MTWLDNLGKVFKGMGRGAFGIGGEGEGEGEGAGAAASATPGDKLPGEEQDGFDFEKLGKGIGEVMGQNQMVQGRGTAQDMTRSGTPVDPAGRLPNPINMLMDLVLPYPLGKLVRAAPRIIRQNIGRGGGDALKMAPFARNQIGQLDPQGAMTNSLSPYSRYRGEPEFRR